MFAQRCVYVRNRSQPFATVRNRPATVRKRPREGHIAVPMVSSPEGVVFGSFKRRVPSFRVAGVALRDIQTCFVTCRKSFFCGRRNTFATLSEDALQFSWQAQHFGRFHRHFAWQAQHFRRVVCANRIGRAASSGDRVQIPWQAWHFVRCDEN